jgi:hypothetical protein
MTVVTKTHDAAAICTLYCTEPGAARTTPIATSGCDLVGLAILSVVIAAALAVIVAAVAVPVAAVLHVAATVNCCCRCFMSSATLVAALVSNKRVSSALSVQRLSVCSKNEK